MLSVMNHGEVAFDTSPHLAGFLALFNPSRTVAPRLLADSFVSGALAKYRVQTLSGWKSVNGRSACYENSRRAPEYSDLYALLVFCIPPTLFLDGRDFSPTQRRYHN